MKAVGNVLWVVLAGVWLVLLHVVTAVLLAVTIIGIPFAIVNVRMAGLALAPFGKQVVSTSSLGGRVPVVRA